ncbi:DUF2723 domain-containing protein [Anaerolineales bacterium HSG6]|nr:DUF2723 domain-containing protein [Anaerolineales bacterium HSG6]
MKNAIHHLKQSSSILFIAIFLTVLTLYYLTLAPGVIGGDAGEHQLAAPLLGIPHATGYPLYILLGKLWTLLIPMGSMAWRMNLLSAVGSALAASVTGLVIYQLSQIEGDNQSGVQHLRGQKQTLQGTSLSLPGAFIGALTLAFGLTLWQWSIITGVRSINVLFFALLTLEAILWAKQCTTNNQHQADKVLRWLALTVGLSLAHHRTTVFYLPSLVLWIWWHDRNLPWQPKRWLPLVGLSLLPLFLYGFIYLRGINNPPYTHETITDLQSFWFLVGASDSSGLFMYVDPQFFWARLTFIWHDILAQLSWPGVLLALLGAGWLIWRQPKQFLFQGLLVLLLFLFVLDFEVVNLSEAPTWYLMPAYFIFAVWVGLGVNVVLRLWLIVLQRFKLLPTFKFPPLSRTVKFSSALGFDKNSTPSQPYLKSPRKGKTSPLVGGIEGGRAVVKPDSLSENQDSSLASTSSGDDGEASLSQPRERHLISHALLALCYVPLLGLLIYSLAQPNWQQIYQQSITPLDDWRQLLRGAQAQRFVDSTLPYVEPNSFILGDWEQFTPLMYAQLIDGQRPDVTPRIPLDNWPSQIETARERDQPTYLMRKTADLIGTPYLSMVGPLIHLQTEPNLETPTDITMLQANLEDELELIGYRLKIVPQDTPGGEQAGPIIQVTLYWRALHTLEWDYALSLRLLDQHGTEIYKKDAVHPVLSSYPTRLWHTGEVVADFYELSHPPQTPPTTLWVLVYRTEGTGQWHNLQLNDSEPLQDGVRIPVARP